MKPKIMFVDDQPEMLDGLRRTFRSFRTCWDFEFVGNAVAALHAMTHDPVDVLVTDMRMPGMDGATLCQEVHKFWPDTIRIILSGQVSDDQMIRAYGLAHRYLAKPCASDELVAAIRQSLKIRTELQEQPLRSILLRLPALPAAPAVVIELLEVLQRPDVDLKKIATIARRDLAICARVMQLVNSAYYGLARRVDDPAMALQLLGVERLAALLAAAGVFSQFPTGVPTQVDLQALAENSLMTGDLAAQIVKRERPGDNRMSGNAAFAGVLHDVGHLVLLQAFGNRYQECLVSQTGSGMGLCESEFRAFGASHAQIGAFVARLWGMEDDIVEAIAFHHSSVREDPVVFGPLTAVQQAEGLLAELQLSHWPWAVRLPESSESAGDHHRLVATWRETLMRKDEGSQDGQ